MPEYSPFPDSEAVVATAMAAANVCGRRIHSSIPATPTVPYAIVRRLGGVPVERHRIDQARIQIDVYGNTKAEARDQADAARLAVHALEGTTSDVWNAAITAVDDEVGLTFLPDPDTNRDRYTFSVIVTLHSTLRS